MTKSRYTGDHSKFKSVLEAEYTWPADYMFKFIVPKDSVPKVEAMFPHHPISFRNSRNGNYISATITIRADSADLIIAIYEKASHIKGLIAL
ncbi:MAG: DUF493 family protein [Bdellovibrionales bacterium]|nr:DUF493 family protein [Bdellovibrionales bacterium]